MLLCLLLIDVLFEGWLQQVFGHPGPVNAKGDPTHILATWPKPVKNGLFLTLLTVTAAKAALDRSWREFTGKVELALVAVAVVMVVAGLLGGSEPRLIAEALYVYFRGVIVFYAWRVLRPNATHRKVVIAIVAVVAVANAALAIAEFAGGVEVFRWLGWTDTTWARLARAHALFNHPNHLGHFLMVVELALLCWFVTREKTSWKLWLLFGFLALGMSASQSRESAMGFAVGAAVIWWFRRARYKPVALALVMVLGFAGMQLLIPKNQATVSDRILGVVNALSGRPGGSDARDDPREKKRQEIRILFFWQSLDLLEKRPVLGYGVGQFGGTVAYQADPWWNDTLVDQKLDPRHPDFRLWGASPDQVDSFWLHLTVETGLVGLLAYLVWLLMLISPVIRARDSDSAMVRLAPAIVAASVVIAFLSPSLEDQLYPVLLFTALGWAWAAPAGTTAPLREPVRTIG